MDIVAGEVRRRAAGNAVALQIDGRWWGGWQDIRITLGCERIPNDFSLTVTERFPGAADLAFEPGQACEVRIGQDRVIRGWVDSVTAGIAPASHKIIVAGRGRCQDLVDCSIIDDEMGGTGFGNAKLRDLARRLAAPYGIEVLGAEEDPLIVETLQVMQLDTPFSIIELMARSQGYLAHENADGNLVLARVGTERHATGFVQGQNVERADVTLNMAERYSEYRVVRFNLEALGDLGHATGNLTWNTVISVPDTSIPRRRRLTIAAEQQGGGDAFSIARANWEKARRYGRSQAVRVTVDSWRDGQGRLWEPNRLARVHLPALKIEHAMWIIGEVAFLRGEQGERAEVMLMPPEAFSPQPTILQRFNVALRREVEQVPPVVPVRPDQ